MVHLYFNITYLDKKLSPKNNLRFINLKLLNNPLKQFIRRTLYNLTIGMDKNTKRINIRIN
ncbi:hypothetical protein bcgnr5386_43680 [Bacillus cereus]